MTDEREPTTSPVGPGRAAAAADRREAEDRDRAEGRFVERGEIGRGGQGVVQKIFDKHLKRYLALKVMDRKLSSHPDERQRFIDEARITGQLDHPNIVPIYDVVDTDAKTEFTMKLVEGETLAERLERGKDELPRLLDVFLKVCDAISFAHSRGVVHRDLKPANIMIGEFGQVYVMDWGCAHIIPTRRLSEDYEARPHRDIVDTRGMVVGTSAYMAPEQALGHVDVIDERTDVFGLGAVLYHILTGVPPYVGTDQEQREQAKLAEIKPPHEAATGRTPPPGIAVVAMRALARKQDARFPSVSALRDEVERFVTRGAFFTPRLFPTGTLIVREGDIADEAYVVTAGRCEAFREERGRRVLLRTFGPGDVFGEGALFASEPRNASVVAVDDVTAIVVTHQDLNRQLGEDSWLGTFIRALTARYRDLESRHTLTRRVVENTRIAGDIIDHISRAGTWIRPGVLGTSWSRLWAALKSDWQITEDQALSIVERTTELSYDAAHDEITLALLSMA